ncbi:hypothetical protein [Butyrivibrio sp. WCD3002]|uniref:hypothetical protein n=1 Tax=Butyrivibrio sp. WCD3002 TaxID=1280676 RepID=UPI0012DC6AAD|nr:hypothetical protein [Butyrivibrio sp. WCD3002]
MDNYEIVMTPRAHFELEEAFVAILELSASLDIAENYVDSIHCNLPYQRAGTSNSNNGY